MLLSCADQEVVAHATQALTNLSADREFVEVIEETAGATSLIQQLISSKESVQVKKKRTRIVGERCYCLFRSI